MKPTLVCFALLWALCGTMQGADLEPLLTTSGKELLNEDFSAAALPSTFRTLKSPDRFQVVDGALQATAQAGQEHSTHGAFMLSGHNFTVAFSAKFDQTGTLYIGIDGYKEEFQGNTHLVRFSLTPERIAWDEKRGGPESKHAISEANRAARRAKQPIVQPTPEQLADPTFFRTEELASREVECPTGQWHEVILEVTGNELVAQVGGQTLLATATVADSKKSRIGIGLTGRTTVLIDNVRVWENHRRPDWEQIRTSLTGTTAANGQQPAE